MNLDRKRKKQTISSHRNPAISSSRVSNRIFFGLVLLQMALAVASLLISAHLRRTGARDIQRQADLASWSLRLRAVHRQVEDVLSDASPAPDQHLAAASIALSLRSAQGEAPKDASIDPLPLFDQAQVLTRLAESPSSNEQWLASMRSELTRSQAVIDHLLESVDDVEEGSVQQIRSIHGTRLWLDRAQAATPPLLFCTLLCMLWLRTDARRQTQQRLTVEEELYIERNSLERRIQERTAELKAEVGERMRFEQLNRGRNQILEMLAHDEPNPEIFRVLAEVLARHRSIWACALHLAEGQRLVLAASAGIPDKLVRHLEHISLSTLDAPEAAALAGNEVIIVEDLVEIRKPWIALLRANGIQSVWSAPFFAPDKRPLGTLTIYALLQYPPAPADLELLENHCQMASLIVERGRLQTQLRQYAYQDNLTGLPNRLLGQDRLSSALHRAERSGHLVAVLWLDLDQFKQVNDVHGHGAGDFVLKEVAVRLATRVRASDTVARMGGDEFMIVMEDLHCLADAERLARDLLESIQVPITFQDVQLSLNCSIGASLFPEHGDSTDELVRAADVAMYEAKFTGTGIRTFSPALDAEVNEQRQLEAEMAYALEHNGFSLHFQPQYDRNQVVAGFEALLRFQHPVLGNVQPGRLIPVAERTHMIVPLGTWVLREACRQNRAWQDRGLAPVRIAVNISSTQFAREDFAEQVAGILEETGLLPQYLELELTEGVLVKDFAESTRQLQRLKGIGVSIAIDDFGTGYSSLNYLHRLPVDSLKIDRSFIQTLDKPTGTLPIVEAIVAMAQRMGLRVVGEGVETTEQMQILGQSGCDLLQGFLFSRPVAADRAADLLAEDPDRDALLVLAS